MSAGVSLTAASLHVEPGGQTTCELVVRNTGSVVDQFQVSVVGDAADWATVEPPTVSLFPDAEETVRVHFAPPRLPTVPPGPMPFGVRVLPSEDPEGVTVEEGTLQVATFHDVGAELSPRTSHGRRRGHHELAFDNRGNGAVEAVLTAANPDNLLGFSFHPPKLSAAPGTAVFSKVRVRPRKRLLRGAPKTHPFQVFVEPEDVEPLTVDAAMLQEPLIPKWLPKALLALVALVLLLVGLWITVLRPTFESAARRAAQEELAEVKEEQEALAAQVAAAEQQAAEAKQQAQEATTAAAGATDASGRAVARTDALVDARDLGDPFDFRLARDVVPGAEAERAFTVPEGRSFALTDIVLQNPRGDQGLMQIRRRTEGDLSVLLEVRLENFRDLDYHFVTPVVFVEGQEIILFVRCENPEGQVCNPAAYFSGFEQAIPPPEAEAEEPEAAG